MNYNKEEGTTRNTGLTRLATRINLDYTISDKLRMSANFSYTNNDNDKAPAIGVAGVSTSGIV